MELYLLRHAETESNKRGAMSSHCADPLSENGLNQAVTIVDELAKLGIQKILCSPYSRAIKTITPFAERFNVTTEIHAWRRDSLYWIATLSLTRHFTTTIVTQAKTKLAVNLSAERAKRQS